MATAVESGKRVSTLGAICRLPSTKRRDDRHREEADQLAQAVGLEQWLDYLTSDLSTGVRRMVEIACVLARQPRLILLDEPTAEVAQREIEQFAGVIRDLRDSTGAGIILIEHDLPLVMAVCDRVIVLAAGSVIADGPPEQVRQNPAVIATYLGADERAVNRSSHGSTHRGTSRANQGTQAHESV